MVASHLRPHWNRRHLSRNFTSTLSVTPACDPESEQRDLGVDEVTGVGTITTLFARNDCQDLPAWFKPGWGDRFKMWDAEITRDEAILNGDFHENFFDGKDFYSDVIHIYSDTDNFARTVAHELAEWAYREEGHSFIIGRAAECSTPRPY